MALSLALFALTGASAGVSAGASSGVSAGASAGGGPRFVMPWMCLEDCGYNASAIAAQLAQLATPGVFTAAAYEDYDLALDGTVTKAKPRSRVSGAVKALGLQSHAMIVSWDMDAIRAVFAAPATFVDSVDAHILAVEGANVTAINLDWECVPARRAPPAVSTPASHFPPSTPCRPHGTAPPVGPVPTPADGVAYVDFLNFFADSMHQRGVLVSVDIATWSAFWNYSAIGQTRVDYVCDMESYTPSFPAFQKQVAFAQAVLPPAKYVVGLENHNFNETEVRDRFEVLKSAGLRQVAIWSTPMPDRWIPYLAAV